MEQTTESELPNWLLDISRYYGGRAMFKLEVPYWLNAYPDLLELIDESQKRGQIIAIPAAGDMYYNDGVPQTFKVEILANTWRKLQEADRSRKVRRQITIDGVEYDLRGRPGQILAMTTEAMKDEIRYTLRDMQRTNQRDAKGAYMYARLIKKIRKTLPQEAPEHYEQLKTALDLYNPPLTEAV